MNSTEWFFPRRLTLDVDAASPLRQTKAAKLLGLRSEAREADQAPALRVPDRSDGRRRAARRPEAEVDVADPAKATLVDGAPEQSHLDPLLAAPARNEFVETVVPFLRGL